MITFEKTVINDSLKALVSTYPSVHIDLRQQAGVWATDPAFIIDTGSR